MFFCTKTFSTCSCTRKSSPEVFFICSYVRALSLGLHLNLRVHVLQLRLEVLLDGLPLELAGGVEEAVVVGKQVRVKVDVFDLEVAIVVNKDC